MLKRFSEIENIKFNEKDFLQTGIRELDRVMFGLGKGRLYVMTGTRGGGKTSLTQQIMLNFVQNGYYGFAYSLEMKPERTKQWYMLQACREKDLIERVSKNTGKAYYEQKSGIIDLIQDWIGDRLLIDDNETFNAKKIEFAIKRNIEDRTQKGIRTDYVVLDNLMRLDISDISNDKWQAQSRLVLSLQNMCQKLNITLVVVCHPNKVKTLPRIEDVGGAGDIINSADGVFIVHRINNDFKARAKEYFGWEENHAIYKFGRLETTTLLEVAKDRDFGNEGMFIQLGFNIKNKRFLNFASEEIKYDWDAEYEEINLDDGDLPF